MEILKALNMNEYSVLKSVDSCIKIIKHCSQLWEFTEKENSISIFLTISLSFFSVCNYKSISIAIYQKTKKEICKE